LKNKPDDSIKKNYPNFEKRNSSEIFIHLSPIKPITIGQLTELLESTNRCGNSSGADFELFYKSSSKTLR